MDIILFILDTIVVVGFWIYSISFLVYKSGKLETKTWEETIVVMLSKIFNFCYSEITGKPVSSEIVNVSLILSDEEILELVERLRENPYLAPALGEYIPNVNGILWCDIRAVKLTKKYEALTLEELCLLLYHEIQSFYMEKRRTSARLYIKIATPQRLYFAIALSEAGYQFLEKQKCAQEPSNEPLIADVSLEEKIEPFTDTAEDDGLCK